MAGIGSTLTWQWLPPDFRSVMYRSKATSSCPCVLQGQGSLTREYANLIDALTSLNHGILLEMHVQQDCSNAVSQCFTALSDHTVAARHDLQKQVKVAH